MQKATNKILVLQALQQCPQVNDNALERLVLCNAAYAIHILVVWLIANYSECSKLLPIILKIFLSWDGVGWPLIRKAFRKLTFLTLWYAHVRVRIRGSEVLVYRKGFRISKKNLWQNVNSLRNTEMSNKTRNLSYLKFT